MLQSSCYYVGSDNKVKSMTDCWDDNDGNKISSCATASRCTFGGYEDTFDEASNVTWSQTSCTYSGDECSGSYDGCLKYPGYPPSNPIELDSYSCHFFHSNCRCADWTTDHCHYGCRYDYTATRPDNTKKYYYELQELTVNKNATGTYKDGYGYFDQEDGSTLTWTCRGNNVCGSPGNVTADGSTTIVIGTPDRSDSTDGCSAGTNNSTYTASTSQYKTPITWTCEWLRRRQRHHHY